VPALVGGKADSANGTDGWVTEPAGELDGVGTDLSTFGIAGVVAVLSQAPRHSAQAQSAITANGVFMQLSCCWWVSRAPGTALLSMRSIQAT
jgi:hypothetical protein